MFRVLFLDGNRRQSASEKLTEDGTLNENEFKFNEQGVFV